ncbi:MAG: hypothetical protein LC102_11665 [Ignavibacteriales bacterium]|nr:hypothetical protein [Ignavibacteriales bacterium]
MLYNMYYVKVFRHKKIRHIAGKRSKKTYTHDKKTPAPPSKNSRAQFFMTVVERRFWQHTPRQNSKRKEGETMPEVVAPGKALFLPDDDAYVRL